MKNNDNSTPTRNLWQTTHTLSETDTIHVNQQQIDLHITNIRPNASSGKSTEITLTNHANEQFNIRVSNTNIEKPILETPANKTITINTIQPSEKQILTTHTTCNLYGNHITGDNIAPNDTYPNNRENQEIQMDSNSHVIGECPVCDSSIVFLSDSAVCTGCNARSDIKQWNVYQKETQKEIQTVIEIGENDSKLYMCQLELESFTSETNDGR